MDYGILSLAPALVALVLAFITRDALFSILIGVLIGILVTGQNLLFGFSSIIQSALGNADFIWVIGIEVFIGMMVALFQKSGAIEAFSNMLSKKNIKAIGAQTISWLLGIFIFFSDYFSPLYVGTVMRGITDKARVSREKLAYICDSTSAPICTLIPFSAWGVYMAGLLVGLGPILDKDMAMEAVIKMVPFNFYGIASIIMVGLISTGVLKDYGPMKKAEKRAMEEGKAVSDTAKPLLSNELENIKPKEGVKSNLLLNFFAPALIIISVTLGTYIFIGSAKTLEAFIAAVAFQFVVMIIQKMGTLSELVDTAVQGIKSVMSAMLILALAYCLNAISKELGTAQYVISVTESWMTPTLLLALTFLICAFISFFTGTSWGTYAIMTPICVGLAFQLTGGAINTVIYGTIAAVMGGGCFGDHCSPLSDTTILSSLASGSDHIDHVKTQLPYALTAAGVSVVGYLLVGIIL
ncbi:Na+/H+ antiporter NhaC [Sedimentibacter acidaminivorans]|uniref:Na+/H+ antiporter NhaC n=1 Tax=Sedimentibacter acidaminivorans TaxID=913099 RepID=A0ABS4GHB1_9FIRM|nr:Na+/H+ antiporter NhaC family protein [Sedimentibacter acidaminivorans]MBP1926775.1 Na+/H+ antiporter NhaC [Sedimentibacter acidaminivorans]